MLLLDGRAVADDCKALLKELVGAAKDKSKNPVLIVFQVGDDEASSIYVRNKKRVGEEIGIEVRIVHLNEDVEQRHILGLIDCANTWDDITGIMVQLPLPEHLDEQAILTAISPEKDVDGFHPYNVGNMLLGNDTLISCTPQGIMEILDYYDIDVEGKECVVVGRSNIVGKPMAMLLLEADGTVTICHSKTKNLKEICKRADILVCAIGKPKFFNREYVKEGAVVIDVGIHRMDDGSLCGDVDFDDVRDIVSAITPVPNGCGKTTVMSLMWNVVKAMEMRKE